jgi:hypothetical protein
MEVSGEHILKAMDKSIAEEYGISSLTEREQALFLLGVRMGNTATEHIYTHKIPCEGAVTSYNYMLQILPLFKKDECFEGKWHWNRLQDFTKGGKTL